MHIVLLRLVLRYAIAVTSSTVGGVSKKYGRHGRRKQKSQPAMATQPDGYLRSALSALHSSKSLCAGQGERLRCVTSSSTNTHINSRENGGINVYKSNNHNRWRLVFSQTQFSGEFTVHSAEYNGEATVHSPHTHIYCHNAVSEDQ